MNGGTRVPTSSGAAFLVRSELMQGYSTARAIPTSGAQLASAVGRDGSPQVFCVGDGGQLFVFAPTEVGQTGWGVRPLHAPVAVAHLAAGTDAAGNVVVVIADAAGDVWWMDDRPWSAWVALGRPFGAGTVDRLRAGSGADGSLIFQAISTMPDLSQIVVSITPWSAEAPWDYVSTFITGRIYDCVPGVTAAGRGAFVSSSDELKGNTNVTFYLDHQIEAQSFYTSGVDDMLAATGVYGVSGVTQVFLLSEQNLAYYLDQGASSLVPIATDALRGTVNFTAIRASRLNTDAGGLQAPLQFFGISTGGSLYVSNQLLPRGADVPSLPWSPLIALTDGLQTSPGSLTLCRDDQGVTRCFAATVDGQLLELWQDGTGDWHIAPINVPYEGELLEFASYSTEITVLDADGQPVVDQPLSVRAADQLSVTINGQLGAIGPDRAMACATNAAGRITLVTPTTDIGVASLQISAGLLGGDVLHVAPDRYIQSTLYPATPAELQSTLTDATYTTPEGTQAPLIDQSVYSKYMDDASKAIWQSMSLAMPEQGDEAQSARLISRRGDTAGVAVMPAGRRSDRIDTARVPDQFWRIEFLERGVRFHPIRDNAEYEEICASLSAQAAAASPDRAAAGRAARSSSSGRPTWGNLWNSVKRGAVALTNVAVRVMDTIVTETQQIVRRIESTIYTAISDALHYVVETVKEVFDLAQGIFSALDAGFDKLFGWLGSLFDWGDIIEAHNNIGDFLGTFIDSTIPKIARQVTDDVEDFLAGFKTEDMTLGDDGDKTFGAASADTMSQADQAPGPSANWMQNQLLNSGGGAPAGVPAVQAAPSSSPLDTFEQAVVAALGGLGDTIIAQFNAALAQGRSVSDMTANQILGVIKTMIENDLIAALSTVVELVYDLLMFLVSSLSQGLSSPWHIPLVSKLYKKYVQRDMSLLDLIALGLAVPVTAAMKIAGLDLSVLGELAANARALTDVLTPAQLMGRAPIDAASRERLRAAGFAESLSNAASQVLGLLYGFGMLVYSPFALLYALDKIKGKWLNLIPAGLSLIVMAFNFPFWGGFPSEGDSYEGDEVFTGLCWALGFILWAVCTAMPPAKSFIPVSPESQPLIPKPDVTPLFDRVVAVVGLVGGGALMGAYLVQAVEELTETQPGFSTAEWSVEVLAKAFQNIVGVLPTAAMPLKWKVFEPWAGQAIYGGVCVFGTFACGSVVIVRAGKNIKQNLFNHVM